jgi:copper chaperone
MIELRVADMTCGSCASTITKAVKSVDPNAGVEVDVKQRLVRVEGNTDSQQLQDAIQAAGYSAVRPDHTVQLDKAPKGCG